MNIKQILLSIPKFGHSIGLHRVQWLLKEILSCDWRKNIDAIHITGSNGKGSTAKFTASILTKLGYQTGLLISPHVFDVNERISLNDKKIGDDELACLFVSLEEKMAVYHKVYPHDTFAANEILFAIAVTHFDQNHAQAVVLEAGIGGRYDATRILPGKTAVLTSLDLEHTNLLGNSLELIAYDKADICPCGGEIFVGNIDNEVLRRLGSYCHLKNVAVKSILDFSTVMAVSHSDTGMVADFMVDGVEFKNIIYGLHGLHQVENSILAIKAVRDWVNRRHGYVDEELFMVAVRKAFSKITWAGRLEKIRDNPPVFVDVAHTPDAINTVLKTVKILFKEKRVILVVGISCDKAIEKMLSSLGSIADMVVCTKATHGGAEPRLLKEKLHKYYPNLDIITTDNICKAMLVADRHANKINGSVIFVTGSFYLVAEVYLCMS
ncbi:MAG: hypothetical protein B6242_13075 [Anaerolineaceae bacterium 4572_78]|nr:MAG: hypothetical protein B6242_13075 [Anaerolineaceae bacterium 4572_78]